MNIEKSFEKNRKRVNKELEKAFSSEVEDLESGMKYGAKEKNRVRSNICLAIAEHYGKENKALSFAASLEMIHNFSLVHDDILDMGKERRGRKSVWMAYGLPQGINIGDALLTKASVWFNQSGIDDEKKVELNKNVSEAVFRILESQAMDLSFKEKDTQSFEDFDKLIWRKVGALMASSAIGAAIISGEDDKKTLETFREYGHHLGPALQVNKDIWEIENSGGREIKEGKRSLITIHALNNLEGKKRNELLGILNKPKEETTDEEVRKAKDLLKEVGSIEYAQKRLNEYSENALEALEGLSDESLKEKLKEVTRYIIDNSLY